MEETKAKKTGGKRERQKYKSLLVWDILLKKTDENHALRLKDIEEHLSHYGITAERHSIKRDIDDILALLNKEVDFDLDELEIEERDLLGYEVEYDAAQHGYKVSCRTYNFEELRLPAKCVWASKFITKSQEQHLIVQFLWMLYLTSALLYVSNQAKCSISENKGGNPPFSVFF